MTGNKTKKRKPHWDYRKLPFEDLGFAKIDHQRKTRSGLPEVVYCQGKSIRQIIKIIRRMQKKKNAVLATRADRKTFAAVRKYFPKAQYNKLGKIITLSSRKTIKLNKNPILIITAGTADLPVAEEARITAAFLGNQTDSLYDVGVAGLQRLLKNMHKLENASVLIVIAGMEGALASVVAGLVDKPVICVPTSVGYGASFKGLSALLGMLNSCSPGVAVVNIDNGFGAACLASIINKMRSNK